jgi:hypothetical protein
MSLQSRPESILQSPDEVSQLTGRREANPMTPGPKRRWPQFTFARHVLRGRTGDGWVGGLVAAATTNDFKRLELIFGVWYGSGALVGAGLLAPLQKKTIGAVAGFLLAYPLIWLL